ncbi:hypothetical protein [Nocardia wallacei]|uniref:hypothetical protein n=1 Tax=Nocardia wallacei TaxID=480035 RepID=UPI002455168D|nr:hypothetical protein [Nocardia wallacei]
MTRNSPDIGMPNGPAPHSPVPVDSNAGATAETAPNRRIQRLRESDRPQLGNGERDDSLSDRIEKARARVAKQYDPALYEEMSEGEIDEERHLHKSMRTKRRRMRKRVFVRQLAAEFRRVKATERARRREEREKRWHEEALSARRRVTDPNAKVGTLHRRATVMSRNLGVVIVGALLWSAVNVGRNLVPDGSGPSGPTWWALWGLSFGIEFVVSIPIFEIMTLASTAARHGQKVDRSKVLLFEGALLLLTVSLNAGPHLADDDLGRAAQYSVAPVMIVVCLWLHAWLSNRYADLIDSVMPESTSADPDSPSGTSESASPGAAHEDDAKPLLQGLAPELATATTVQPAPRIAGEMPGDPEPDPQRDEFGPTASDLPTTALDQCERIAYQLVVRKESRLNEDHLVAVLRMAQSGANAHAIATQMTATTGTRFARSTIDRAIDRARQFGLRTNNVDQEVTAHSA